MYGITRKYEKIQPIINNANAGSAILRVTLISRSFNAGFMNPTDSLIIIGIPSTMEFLYMYGDASGLITFLNIMDFITFVLQYLLAFGISFELPLIMYAISMSGIVGNDFWRKNIRYAILAIIIFGAIVTPDGSGVTMWFIAAPMMALYLVGMIVIEHKNRKKDLNLKS